MRSGFKFPVILQVLFVNLMPRVTRYGFPRLDYRGHGVRVFLDSCGIEEVRTAYRSPWQNPFVERFVGTLRRELLDHIVVLSERYLTRLLKEFVNDYYHVARPHQGLDGDTPSGSKQPASIEGPTELLSFPVCGGLHHRYELMAA